MKKFVWSVIAFGFLLFGCCGNSNAGGLGEYSTGYRMGQLTKFSVKGMMFKSGEGQMLMGADSTPYQISDGDGGMKTINPWYFSSTDKSVHPLLEQKIGEYVVISYNESHVKMPNVDTAYEVTMVEEISAPLDRVCVASNITKGSNSDGERVGRIVKASAKGMAVDSYEIMFQQGNAGAQFKNMSISKDKDLFDCAVAYLKAGQRVKITYNESIINLNIFGRDTNYDIVRIEPIKKASEALN